MNITNEWKSKKHIQILEELQYTGFLTTPSFKLTIPPITPAAMQTGKTVNSALSVVSSSLPQPIQSLTQLYSVAWNLFTHTHKAVESAEFKIVYVIRMTLLLLSTRMVKEIAALMKIFHIINLAKFMYETANKEKKTEIEKILEDISQIPIVIFSAISYTISKGIESVPFDYKHKDWIKFKLDSMEFLKQHDVLNNGKFKTGLSVEKLKSIWNTHKRGFSEFMIRDGTLPRQMNSIRFMEEVKYVMN